MVKIMNLFKDIGGVYVPHTHLEYHKQVILFCEEVRLFLIIVCSSISYMKMFRDLKDDKCMIDYTSGLPDIRKDGGNGSFIVPNIKGNLNFVRQYSTIGKETSNFSSKDSSSSDLDKLEQLIKNNQDKNFINTNVLKSVGDINILKLAYYNIKSKPGNMTPANDDETLDGIDNKYFIKLSNDILTGKLKFKPAKRIEIPKKNSDQTRPLSIRTPREKVVEEAINIVLKGIFEPLMLEVSHGFRPNRSCLTAIWDIRNKFSDVRWFIEIDISKCFDTIPHNIIIDCLNEKIHDKGFNDLIYKIIRSGYIDNKGTFYKNKLGVPQGSIISPVLANIVLTKTDIFLTKLCEEFHVGNQSRMNKEYSRLSDKIRYSTLLSEKLHYINLRKKIRRSIPNDSNYKRCKFVRYADDILIGVIGSKNDCIEIRDRLKDFLSGQGLKLNLEKSKITYSSDHVKFLSYLIRITPYDKRPTNTWNRVNLSYKVTNRTRPLIMAPTNEIIAKLNELGICKHGKLGIPTSLSRLIHEEHRTIILYYKALGNGIFNYYRLATNFETFRNRIGYILWYSFILTLARKFKLRTMRKTFIKFGTKFACYKTNKKGDRVIDLDFDKHYFNRIMHVKEHKDFKSKSKKFTDDHNIDDIINKYKYMLPRSIKLLDSNCFICNSSKNIQIHHVKHLKDIKNTADYLKSRQIKMNRKQIPLCLNCHWKVHNGQYDGPGL